ncbi:MAG: tetratricopeptide repeat protein [Bacteroidota bacterium]
MKRLILQLFITCLAFGAYAQKEIAFYDANFKFTLGFSSEREWRVLFKKDTTSSYSFGYTYIDKDVGFIFQQVGEFKVDDKGSYILDPASLNKHYDRQITHQYQYKYPQAVLKLWPMAVIKPNHYNELKIKGEPAWLKKYYTYTDTLKHNYLWGSMYADAGDGYKALPYLFKVQKVDPHYAGLELAMASAYFRGEQYDNAIDILNVAIAHAPDSVIFYMQLGMAYDRKKDWNKAIESYKRGLALITVDKSEQKYWLAGCISNMYEELKNDAERIKWRAKSDEYNPHPGGTF